MAAAGHVAVICKIMRQRGADLGENRKLQKRKAISGGERETFFDLERLVTYRLSLDSREEGCILLSLL